jgi:hypothetical protein
VFGTCHGEPRDVHQQTRLEARGTTPFTAGHGHNRRKPNTSLLPISKPPFHFGFAKGEAHVGQEIWKTIDTHVSMSHGRKVYSRCAGIGLLDTPPLPEHSLVQSGASALWNTLHQSPLLFSCSSAVLFFSLSQSRRQSLWADSVAPSANTASSVVSGKGLKGRRSNCIVRIVEFCGKHHGSSHQDQQYR